MELYPRRHTPHVRILLGRSLQMLRHTLDTGTGFSQDGLLSTARDFNIHTTKRKRGNRFKIEWLYTLAWLTGVVLAVVYLLWFFKNIFENTVR